MRALPKPERNIERWTTYREISLLFLSVELSSPSSSFSSELFNFSIIPMLSDRSYKARQWWCSLYKHRLALSQSAKHLGWLEDNEVKNININIIYNNNILIYLLKNDSLWHKKHTAILQCKIRADIPHKTWSINEFSDYLFGFQLHKCISNMSLSVTVRSSEF